MPNQLFEEEVLNVLKSGAAGSICVKGRWGVGKTYWWKSLIGRWQADTAKQTDDCEPRRYSYVSLFGLSSLDDLRYAIFANSIRLDQIKLEPTLESVGSNFGTVLNVIKAGVSGVASSIGEFNPAGDNGKLLVTAAFMSVRDMVICIDDLERCGGGLNTADVMGLIDQLRVQRDCTVFLITNEDALNETRKNDFALHADKTFDRVVEFSLSSDDCAEIALKGTSQNASLISECISKLSIRNIRLANRIVDFCSKLNPILAGRDESLTVQAVKTLTLALWIKYGEGERPTIEFLKAQRSEMQFASAFDSAINEKHGESREEKWRSLFREIGFVYLDEFDEQLVEGVERGYFDTKKLQLIAENADALAKERKAQDECQDAWKIYHGSFANNEPQVIESLVGTLRNNIQSVSPGYLGATVHLLKDLKRNDCASQLINEFVDQRVAEANFWRLDDPLFDQVSDVDVIEAFRRKFESFQTTLTPEEALIEVSRGEGFSPSSFEIACELSEQNFFDLFKREKGPTLRRIVNFSLRMASYKEITDEAEAAVQRAKAALQRISDSSPLNARRLKHTHKVVLEQKTRS